MKRNIKGFRLNKNGKPIIVEVGTVRHKEFRGQTYKENGEYFYYVMQHDGSYIYKS